MQSFNGQINAGMQLLNPVRLLDCKTRFAARCVFLKVTLPQRAADWEHLVIVGNCYKIQIIRKSVTKF
jgi:hypothetical protein